MQETGAIAAMAEEELLFEAGVNISKGAALGLEEWGEAFSRRDDIKSHKEVVVCKGNDTLGCSEGLEEDNALHGGVFSIAFERHDKERSGPSVGRGGDMPGGVGC